MQHEKTMYGLCDCNNFFASCERVFRPELEGLPVVMQYPNSIPIYTAFALCFAGPYIDKRMQQSKETELKNEQ